MALSCLSRAPVSGAHTTLSTNVGPEGLFWDQAGRVTDDRLVDDQVVVRVTVIGAGAGHLRSPAGLRALHDEACAISQAETVVALEAPRSSARTFPAARMSL